MKKIKRISIYYFSGTGNARQIAAWISEFAHKKEIDCQSFNIASVDIHSFNSIDPETLIVIISPVHGFNYPKITLKFIKHFPKGNNSVVLMNTRAGMRIGRFVTPGLTGVAFILSSFLLKRKGYKIKGQIPFDMPSNWISIHPALKERSIRFIFKKNYERVEKHCDKIFSGKAVFLSYRDLIQDILITPFSLLYYLAGRFVFAKSYYASIDCDHCGLCVKQCPVKAIKTINDRPYWTFKCESCMRCMNSCPKKAIETAHGLFVIISVLSSVIITVLLENIFTINFESEAIRLIIFTFIFFALLWLLYRIQHLLLQFRSIGRIISFTSLTHYKFWGRYKSTPYKWKG